MRIKALKNLSIGKTKNKSKKVDIEADDSEIPEISEIKEGEKEDTTGQKKQEPSRQTDTIPEPDDIIAKPHGPVAELSIEPEDLENDSGFTLDELDDNDSLKLGEEIKISEVTAESTVPSPEEAPTVATAPANVAKPEEQQETKLDDGDSLNNLFSEDEEEENTLASLINSLPDVSIQELMDDLEEIHRIIKEWRPTSKGIR